MFNNDVNGQSNKQKQMISGKRVCESEMEVNDHAAPLDSSCDDIQALSGKKRSVPGIQNDHMILSQ